MAIKLEYYSDILCVWAWIAQRRQDELRQHFGSRIDLVHHFVNIFGNTQQQIGDKWASRGGFEGFGQHVIEAASPYLDAPVVSTVWQTVRPASSTPAHAVLKAVETSHTMADAESFARVLRTRFFTGPTDIGRLDRLLEIADEQKLNIDAINAALNSGAAMADVKFSTATSDIESCAQMSTSYSVSRKKKQAGAELDFSSTVLNVN